MKEKKKRLDILDELRGIAILCMVTYHFIFQIVLWLQLSESILETPLVRIIQLSAQVLFISLAGFSCTLSRNNIKRGIQCLGIAVVITCVTWLIVPEEKIIFGILHFLGTAILLYALCESVFKKGSALLGMMIMSICFVWSYYVIYKSGWLAQCLRVPYINGLWKKGMFNLLGIPSPSFQSADYFPLIPWFFIFAMGVYGGIYYKREPNMQRILGKREKGNILLTVLGRRSLLIYILHIPLIMGIIFSLKKIIL